MANDNKLVDLADLKASYDNCKHTQTAVSSPTASGTAVAFIDSITQNANGVITPTKKTVAGATQSAAGLMSAADKKKLDGIAEGAQVNSITGVKGNAESSYRTGNVNLTPANIGAKTTQTAVSSPTASGTAVAFIDSISQNAQGVITATKKTVAGASQTTAGLMSAADKKKLDGISEGAQANGVTGVKGNVESSYRTGNVNITPANIGALTKEISRDTFSDLNSTTLVGHSVLNNTDWQNMPPGLTSGTKWFDVYLFGYIQLAVGYSERPTLWVRTYTNNAWTSWYNMATRVKGSAESSYHTGDVNLTAENVGAHPARTNLVVTNDTDYSGSTTTVTKPVVQIVDTNNFVRHQVYAAYSGNNGSFYTYLAARWPNGSSANVNQIGVGFDADGNRFYSVSDPAAFRSAIGVTIANIGAATSSELAAQDLNNVKTPGFYYAGGDNMCINKPSGVSTFGMIVIHSAGGAYYTQILYQSNSAMAWKRTCNNGTWTDWGREVNGVKGNAESEYRTGNVNITPANIGAVAITAVIDVAHGGTNATTSEAACANLGAAQSIQFASGDTTAALIYNKLSKLALDKPALCRLYSSNVAALTGKTGELASSGGYGTVIKTGTDRYRFDLCRPEADVRWCFSVNVTSSAITPDKVYRYAGTLIS